MSHIYMGGACALVQRLGIERRRLVLQRRDDSDKGVETVAQEEVGSLRCQVASIALW